MKMRLFSFILVVMLAVGAMTGCQSGEAERKMESAGKAVEHGMESAGRAVEHGMESIGDTRKQTGETTSTTASSGGSSPADAALTMEEAQSIALKHAGLTADQVTALHTEYEIEHGVAQYDVEFHHENREYDYEIHANTGEILSFSKDN